MEENDFPAITGPSAWTAAELQGRDDFEVHLGKGEQSELLQVLQDETLQNRSFETLCEQDYSFVKLGSRLSEVQSNLEQGSGVCWLRGLPIDGLSVEDCQRLIWAVASHLGTPISQSAAGDRLFHVRDEGFSEGDPRARGPSSKKKLSFHTDRCDVIGFLCRRQALEGGENELVSSVSLYNRMLETRPDLVQVLFEPYRYQRHNVDTGNTDAFYEQPVFSYYRGQFAAFLMRVLIERAYSHAELPPMSSLQREALDYLAELAETDEFRVRFRLQAGDFLFVNNLITLHRRQEFTDHTEPDQKRHLLRVWLATPNSRELTPAFAPSFGETKGGAIRGGMAPKTA